MIFHMHYNSSGFIALISTIVMSLILMAISIGLSFSSYSNRFDILTSEYKTISSDFDKPFAKVKRKYPAYYWPQLLLEEIVKNANKREKERLAKVVEQLRDKTELSKQLMKLL